MIVLGAACAMLAGYIYMQGKPIAMEDNCTAPSIQVAATATDQPTGSIRDGLAATRWTPSSRSRH